MQPTLRLTTTVAIGIANLIGSAAYAQSTRSAVTEQADSGDGITLNFPENTDLTTVVDYVSRRLGMNIVYDDTAKNRKVTLTAPAKIPEQSLLPLLESLLRSKGLAMIDSDIPGWKRIVPVPTLAPIAKPDGEHATTRPVAPAAAVTRLFPLEHASAKDADTSIKPFLTQPGGTSQPLVDQRMIVVTDYATNMSRIAELIRLLDSPGKESSILLVPVRNADASKLAGQIKQLIAVKTRSTGVEDKHGFDAVQDARTNQIALIGPKDRVAEAAELVKQLDEPLPETQNPVRFYKLANATATDVVATLRAIDGDETPGTPKVRESNPSRRDRNEYMNPTLPGGAATGVPGAAPSIPPTNLTATGAIVPVRGTPTDGSTDIASRSAAPARRTTVVADANTNSVIVVADPSTQRLYEQLIKTLDKRRPQVMIEATIVSLDTSNGFSLAVEVSGIGKADGRKILTFSSFGLSTVDALTGQLKLNPGLGLNGALLGSDAANVVLKTLETNSRSRVVASPRVLVNDNMVGQLSSVSKAPYTSTNALTGNTATTSFGGYADAGTEILLTPHISEADYLQLEYELTLSSFTDKSTDGIPPPQQQNRVQSKVTIPDGSMIVVGGLNSRTLTDTVQKVPILGDIPLIKYLFRSQETLDRTSTLFVFIRPVILRDDQFRDLQAMSDRDTGQAAVPGSFPSSEPLHVR